MNWPKHPLIFEINTWVWLKELGRKYQRPLHLGSVPSTEWDALIELDLDAVWFMGVWERSPAGIEIAMQNESLQHEFRRCLPDLRSEDVVGSPYCIRRYVVDERLGGKEGLAIARAELAKRNMHLLLDFVPNHVAPDHPWVFERPDYFIAGSSADLRNQPESFLEVGGNIIARGRDPYFPPWPDVLQLNAFNNGLRNAALETLTEIARQADGVRCDMAMLFLNEIFGKTWSERAGGVPSQEYWKTLITAVKNKFPDFLFVAESYWDLESQLQHNGFDYCYDKRLYDRIRHDHAAGIRSHLGAEISYQEKLVRFIENHDEPRAASVFPPEKARAAAVLTMTLPGAKLLHEGQIEGFREKLPVFLSRRPPEAVDAELQDFYFRLLRMLKQDVMRNGRWCLCECTGWADNSSFQNLVISCWTGRNERCLIVVNLAETSSQGRVRIPWDDIADTICLLSDGVTEQTFERDGNDLMNNGLFVDLGPWAFHCFNVGVTKRTLAVTMELSSAGDAERLAPDLRRSKSKHRRPRQPREPALK